jgi:hypothetical protein
VSGDRRLAAKELFLALRELPPGERQRRLEDMAEGDRELVDEVASLLVFADDEGPGSGGGDDVPAVSARLVETRREAAARVAADLEAPTPRALSAASTASGAAPPHFGPGHVFAGRYRIVAELGRGGMGRVFRAQDLVLGEEVALKLLTGSAPVRVRRLVEEVRLARRVTHPNVCRVFDFGDAEGETFLTMEYVDGEDLRSLLSRIGRLPPEKLHDAAQQLCAGLAAIHAQGIVHCDLKPGNVMVDGRGSVRISDFGLATVLAAESSGELLGTPAYMAPELWTDRSWSVASDVYALGLVLHEMATGERVLRAPTPGAYRTLHRQPPALSERLADTDPRFDSVVRQCLEPEPHERPASVAEVAAALPAGDRLEMALLAGELPSPETVAGAELPAGRRAGATAAAALLAVCLVALLALSDSAFPGRAAWRNTPPEAAVTRAGAVLRQLGHDLPAAHQAWGFQPDTLSSDPHAVVLWYRQAGDWMVPESLDLQDAEIRVSYYDPPPLDEGMAQLLLDPAGHLVALKVLPAGFGGETRGAIPAGEPNWPALLAASGLPPTAAEVAATVVPPMFADRRRAWLTPQTRDDQPAIRLEAAALGPRVVFADVAPTTAEPGEDPAGFAPWMGWAVAGDTLLWAIVGAAALALARKQLREGRSDRLGARRIALFIASVSLLRWALGSDHVPLLDEEVVRLAAAAGRALAEGLLAWLAYVALEPAARRYWPRALVAWSRLLRGRGRDTAVGRSLLLGAAAGSGLALLGVFDRLLVRAAGLPEAPGFLVAWQLESALGARRWLSAALSTVVDGVYWAVLGLFLLAMLRQLLGRSAPALAAWVLLFGAYGVVVGAHPAVSWATVGFGSAAVGALVLLRGGLLAWAVALAVGELLLGSPVTIDMTAWYGEAGAFSLAAVAGVGALGWWRSASARESAAAFRRTADANLSA